MQPLAIGISDFADIRQNGQVYVDKTAWLHRLATDPNCRFFFLARPRRFGKSLMISTFKAMFEGRRELFKGLAIEKTNYDWAIHPVLQFNLGFCANEDYDGFVKSFPVVVREALKNVGVAYDDATNEATNFGKAIDELARRGPAPVILIDEYDDPVAAALKNPEAAEKVRDYLAPFFRQIKDRSGKIRFLMITGVSKFTKMSVFSALSSLVDISFDDAYAAMLGFTEDELDKFFGERLRAHAQTMKLDDAAYRQELKRMYDGYRFGKFTETRVYNPVSVSMTLLNNEPEFACYWSTTGKSSFLMNFLKREEYLELNIDGDIKVDENAFDVSDLHRLSPVGMLFQTGYLTIKGFDDGIYTLRIPNEEVRRDLSLLTAGAIAKRDWQWAAQIGVHLRCQEWDKFFQGLEALYAGLVYGSTEKQVHESSYTRNLCFLLWGQGFQVKQEDQQSAGRADLVADHSCGTYIFEFKVDKPAEKALDQARAREYAAPYRAAGKPVWLIGLSFDGATRRLVGHEWQEVHD